MRRRRKVVMEPPAHNEGSVYPEGGLKSLSRPYWPMQDRGHWGQQSHVGELIKPKAFRLDEHQTIHPFVRVPVRTSHSLK